MQIIKYDNKYYFGEWSGESVKHFRSFQTFDDKLYLDTRKTSIVSDYMITRAVLCSEIMKGNIQGVKEYINEIW